MDALFTSISTIIAKILEILGIVTLGLLKNWIFLLIIGIVILSIIIRIIFKMIKNTFYWNGKRIKGYAYWQPTGRWAEMDSVPVRISRREFKKREKRGEEVTYILEADEDFNFDEEL